MPLDKIHIAFGSLGLDYTIRETTAPKAYDGFGTLTLADIGDTRIVLIRDEHLAWQEGRYASGMHSPTVPDLTEDQITETLYERIKG